MTVTDLNALSDELLAQAHEQASGRASTTVRGWACMRVASFPT